MSLPENYGRYQIKKILGKGGMATVYLAHDPRFGRDVALKAVAPGFNEDPTFQSRFEREARTIATLEHHAIVPVYDFGEDNGQLYLVMRHMSNGTLADRIIQGPMNGVQAIPVIRRIADALDHAHQHRVIHRDLKPGNILFDEYERAYLSDFGIVKLAAEGTQADLTGSGVIGTPAYMSPEQIHGDEVIDGRSDIYTLGVILFEMLTGRKPYRADTPVKQMMAHVMEPIPDIAKILPNLPADSVTVLQRALAKDKESRYQKAQDLTADLTTTLTGQNFVPIERSQPVVIVDHNSETVSEEFPTLTNLLKDENDTVESAGAPLNRVETKEDHTVVSTPKQSTSRFPWVAIALLLILGVVGFLVTQGRLIPIGEEVSSNGTIEATVIPTLTSTVAVESVAETTPVTAPVSEPTEPPSTRSSEQETTEPFPPAGLVGLSANNQPIEYVQIGQGANLLIIVGGIHAGIAPSSVALVEALQTEFEENSELVQDNVQLVFIPNLNPDGAEGSLLNSNGVDLNKNWDCAWSPSGGANRVTAVGVGGTSPFSEPETAGFQQFILERQEAISGEVVVLFFDAPVQTGWVSAGRCGGTSSDSAILFESLFSSTTNYLKGDIATLQNQTRSGMAIDWLDANGIPAFMVWLPDANSFNLAPNLEGILAIIQQISR